MPKHKKQSRQERISTQLQNRYTSEELIVRNKILQSQKLIGDFLDSDIINKLVSLFNEDDKTEIKITKYVEDERKVRGMRNENIIVKSELYGETNENSTLFLKIIKNGIEIIHLTLHLVPITLNSSRNGIIHIFKNIYYNKSLKKKKYKLYALILVTQPGDKPKSLEFSIATGYNTPHNFSDVNIIDPELQKEMDVIITVLNRLFDEDNELYIGNKDKLYPIHNKTDNVLNNINKHSTIFTRKNKGTRMLPNFIDNNVMTLMKPKKKINPSKRRTRRKV